MIAGRIFAFWVLFVISGAILYQVWRSQRATTQVQIRPIAALDRRDALRWPRP